MSKADLRILVADDDAGARELIAAILDAEGWPTPTTVEDGEVALRRIGQEHWDILVTDLDMPRMRGDELVVQALEEDPDLSIVVTTGDGTVGNAVDLIKKGATDFIPKPYDVDDFLASMERAKTRALGIHELKGMRQTVEALLVALESKDRERISVGIQGNCLRRVSCALQAACQHLELPRGEPSQIRRSYRARRCEGHE